MSRYLSAVGVFLAAGAIAAAQSAPTHHAVERLHGDPKAYMAELDNPARDAWQKPHEVVTALGLVAGQRVADIGAGSGYFALRFAHRVGAAGRVFAVDISRDMVGEVRRRAEEAGLASVEPILAKPDDPGLPDGGVDLIFICNTWHHIERRHAYLARLRRTLAPGGRLAIVDFHKDAPVGPPASMKLAREEVLAELERAGFRLETEHTFLPYQYFLVFRPS